ncbi:MAG: 6-bladed beta-propeller, partial [Bacteroidia bacterium]|nr:6-bladed beta-propeller [Bacteroidia bacterium]
SRKLLKFKLEDGSFIEEKNSILFAQNIDLLNDSSYIFYTMGDGSAISGGSPDWHYKVIITDRADLTIKKKYYPGECSLYGQYPFIKTNHSFKVHLPYNDTLYEVTKDTIAPALLVDFAGFGLPKGFCYLSMEQHKQYDVNTMAYLMNAYESENYYLFMWGYKNRIRWHLWSKSKQKGLNFYWLYDDLDGLNQYISFKKWEDESLVAMFNSVDITTQKNIQKENIYQKLIDKGWVPDENSNPVIAIYNIGF